MRQRNLIRDVIIISVLMTISAKFLPTARLAAVASVAVFNWHGTSLTIQRCQSAFCIGFPSANETLVVWIFFSACDSCRSTSQQVPFAPINVEGSISDTSASHVGQDSHLDIKASTNFETCFCRSNICILFLTLIRHPLAVLESKAPWRVSIFVSAS